MIKKLRANYSLSKVLISIFFVLAYILYSWQSSLAVTTLTLQQSLSGQYNLWIALFSSALLGVLLLFLVPVVSNFIINRSHFYTVPRAEYGLLAQLFFALYFLICGALRIINLFTPILLVWGEILFPVIVSLGCIIWFYSLTAKLYFNDQTKPYYFRTLAITYLILLVVAEVLL